MQVVPLEGRTLAIDCDRVVRLTGNPMAVALRFSMLEALVFAFVSLTTCVNPSRGPEDLTWHSVCATDTTHSIIIPCSVLWFALIECSNRLHALDAAICSVTIQFSIVLLTFIICFCKRHAFYSTSNNVTVSVFVLLYYVSTHFKHQL